MPTRLLDTLAHAGALKAGFRERVLADESAEPERVPLDAGRPDSALLRVCDAGGLEGGLSVAWNLSPEELVGPLCHTVGGAARRLRLLDVRDRPELELTVHVDGLTERWAVESLEGLVHNLNDLFREASDVRAAAVLGEWQDMLQLWCVPKSRLPRLLRERYFDPRNRADLEQL